MEKQTKTILIVSIIFAVLIIAYALYTYTNLPAFIDSKINNAKSFTENGTVEKPYNEVQDENKILFLNDRGINVRIMQEIINTSIVSFGYTTPTLTLDGVYGNKTENAVRAISDGKLMSGNVTYKKVSLLQKISSAPLYSPNPKPIYNFLNF